MKQIPFSRNDREQALKCNRYFSGLDDEVIHPLVEQTMLCHYQAGEPVFWEADRCRGLYIIQTGRVKLYKISSSGREMIITVLGDDETFNEAPVFDQGGNPVNASTLNESRIWLVDAAAIRRLVDHHPDAARNIIQNFASNLRMLVNLAADLSFYPVTARLARLLLDKPAAILSGEGALRITQDELASRIGTVREVVARSLKELESSGAIHSARGKIIVKDPDLLAEWE